MSTAVINAILFSSFAKVDFFFFASQFISRKEVKAIQKSHFSLSIGYR